MRLRKPRPTIVTPRDGLTSSLNEGLLRFGKTGSTGLWASTGHESSDPFEWGTWAHGLPADYGRELKLSSYTGLNTGQRHVWRKASRFRETFRPMFPWSAVPGWFKLRLPVGVQLV